MGLVLANQKKLYVYILSMVFHVNDADDILQDTLVLMWEKFDEFQPGTDFTAWGKAIARHKILKYLHNNSSSRLHFNDNLLNIIEAESSRLDNLTERLAVLKKCAAHLSQKESSVIMMRYEQGLSFNKIAMTIGISKQSVYRFISRVHVKLAKCMKQSLGQEQAYEY